MLSDSGFPVSGNQWLRHHSSSEIKSTPRCWSSDHLACGSKMMRNTAGNLLAMRASYSNFSCIHASRPTLFTELHKAQTMSHHVTSSCHISQGGQDTTLLSVFHGLQPHPAGCRTQANLQMPRTKDATLSSSHPEKPRFMSVHRELIHHGRMQVEALSNHKRSASDDSTELRCHVMKR